MRNDLFNRVVVLILSVNIFSLTCFAEDKKSLKDLSLTQIVLPSEVKQISKNSGSIFYNKSVKGKVLIPVHFWGELNRSGLHFVPIGTKFIDGISMAGGPRSNSKLDNVRLMRKENGKVKNYTFDLSEGGKDDAHFFTLKSGDTVFVERSTFIQDRAYVTSLANVAVSILSAIVLYRTIKNDNNPLKGFKLLKF